MVAERLKRASAVPRCGDTVRPEKFY
ncbi:unnamed protein product [Acanthoscelides obtectus]|uniref:Uncharacterized protein n=1 Tax=Acanthoscelides obtectus TaxID=200917 RepID=A0A9P0LM28_ACAOB|nr:unnamed protein product [Acanthoscelides obtectus]CAK1679933.1 hypothetical protein AOBTE_LOCUS32461 [Acanthoscelides obtectus]